MDDGVAEQSVKLDEEAACSLYLSRTVNNLAQPAPEGLSKSILEDEIISTAPQSSWSVSETSCGLIATFALESDADKLVERGNLARIFQGPIQVARFSARDSCYRQSVFLRDVPWAVPLEDLSSALAKQGIPTATIERCRQYVRVEVLDSSHYELLIRQGLDFFGAARFSAMPERASWWRTGTTAGVYQPTATGAGGHADGAQSDGVLQCYRCQGFWHVAANCRHLPRCVRCGEPHSVEFCPRARSNPVCCHCFGPHHAAYRQCPVRLQLLNATPVSITLSTSRCPSSNPEKTLTHGGQSTVTSQPPS